jgi:DNA primase large subunit
MKITREQLKQIIKEELEMSMREQDDANAKIDKAQAEAQKIAGKLAQELEKVSKTSGLDVATLATLVSQFIAQES